MITILGPTASGKTSLAVRLANQFNGEIISADSRQIYKGMDIGTGKDISEYIINKKKIKYHLIDIINPNQNYSVFQFKIDFNKSYNKVQSNGKNIFLCGGTGLYIESILLNYEISNAPLDINLRAEKFSLSLNQLILDFKRQYPKKYNSSYHTTKRRIIRSMEILNQNEKLDMNLNQLNTKKTLVLGIKIHRTKNLSLIRKRLFYRLENGMIEEVEQLINNGLDIERLNYFGLEYKFIGKYINNEFSFNEMRDNLNIAINQFAKRQMTFFRRMEKRGIQIHWIDNYDSALELVKAYYENNLN